MDTTIIIGIIFLSLGLLAGYFARRFVNITVFVILIYAGMITLEALGMTQNWPIFNELSGYLFGIGKTTIKLFINLIDGVPILASGLFLAGGVVGLLINQH